MRIAILSGKSRLYSTQRLVQAAKERGHEARVIDTLRCYMNISAHHPAIRYKGRILENFDAVIPRFGASLTSYGTAVLRQFEMMQVLPLNEAAAIMRARDKLYALQLLSGAGIDMPSTGFADAPDDIQDLIRMVGGAPLVVKLLQGSQGIGVALSETHKAAESVIQAFLGMRANIMVQEYIKEAQGADIRCFVIGNKVAAAIKRQAQEGEFRSNLHRGGAASPVRITAAERKLALRAAEIIGLDIAGVDILRSDRGPLVMEVNASPGLEGIEKATGMDIAGLMIGYLEKKLKALR